MSTLATTHPTTVRDPRSGRIVTVKGAGALKGKLRLRKGIDLTKPVAAQVVKSPRKPKVLTGEG